MRKFWYYLACIAVCAFAPACSDDNDDPDPDPVTPVEPTEPTEETWELIPSTPITTENATMSVNGADALSNATMALKTTSATEGSLTLNNVLPGYPSIEIPVTLTEGTDQVNFKAATTLTTPPALNSDILSALMGRAELPLYDLATEGWVTTAGKANLTLTTTFTKEAQGGLTGNWNFNTSLGVTAEGMITSSPLQMTWTPVDYTQPNMMQTAQLVNLFGSCELCQLFNQLQLCDDGNLTALYYPAQKIDATAALGAIDQTTMSIINLHADDAWVQSPKNLVMYYVDDTYIYILLNIPAIINQVATDKGEEAPSITLDTATMTQYLAVLTELGVKTDVLMLKASEWLNKGVPLRYEKSDTGLKLYVDRELAAPIIEALLPALPSLNAYLANADEETLATIQTIFTMLGITSLDDIATIWTDNTDAWEVALNFTAAD